MLNEQDVEQLGHADMDEVRAREGENYFTPSAPAEHPYGILYQGEFETPSDGTAQAVRLHASALAATGVPLILRSFSGVVVSEHGVAEPVHVAGMPSEVTSEVGHILSTDIATFRPVIKHVVIRSAEHCRQLLMPRGAIPLEDNIEAQMAMRDGIYDNTIVYSVWERDRIDPGIAQHLARVKQCWVPCSHNRHMLIASGVPAERMHVVPHPYRDDDMIHVCTKRPAGYHDGWRRFYSIGRWEPRKGFYNLMRAFLTAFTPEDKVSLTIKYSGNGQWPGYPTPEAALEEALLRSIGWTDKLMRERITILDGRVKRSMIVRLHHENNIYVSASHGEAWGIPSFDAKLAGNALVYVSYGGVVDFADDDDISVPYRLGPVDPSYKWEHGARWADYDLSDLVDGLRRAQIPETFERPQNFEKRFSMRAVGAQMRDLVDVALPPEARYAMKGEPR
jgi:glycosyltransferase involved in cell wall biosynthesis